MLEAIYRRTGLVVLDSISFTVQIVVEIITPWVQQEVAGLKLWTIYLFFIFETFLLKLLRPGCK